MDFAKTFWLSFRMRLMKDDERPSQRRFAGTKRKHHPKSSEKTSQNHPKIPKKSEEMASDHCAVFAEMDFVEDPEVKEEELLLIQ